MTFFFLPEDVLALRLPFLVPFHLSMGGGKRHTWELSEGACLARQNFVPKWSGWMALELTRHRQQFIVNCTGLAQAHLPSCTEGT